MDFDPLIRDAALRGRPGRWMLGAREGRPTLVTAGDSTATVSR